LAELGIAAQRVGTVADPAAVAKFGMRADGNLDASDTGVLAELANLAAGSELDVPIAGLLRLDEVREAYRELERRHTRGKIVLRP
jgi:NADPH:quinone reductase-like Zn-dependent oxidoreductase